MRAGIAFPATSTIEVEVDDYKCFQIQAAAKLKVKKLTEGNGKGTKPEMGVDAAVENQSIPPDDSLRCPHCEYQGNTKKGLSAHIRQAHPDL